MEQLEESRQQHRLQLRQVVDKGMEVRRVQWAPTTPYTPNNPTQQPHLTAHLTTPRPQPLPQPTTHLFEYGYSLFTFYRMDRLQKSKLNRLKN